MKSRLLLLCALLTLSSAAMSQSLYQQYIKAAKAGDAKAQVQVGIAYEKGEGVPKDMSQAVYWFEKAAEQGDVSEQGHVAYYYYNGIGVQKDLVKAAYWWRKAAEQGSAEGQHDLALCYYFGEGVPKDYTQAFQWWSKAAEWEHGPRSTIWADATIRALAPTRTCNWLPSG